MTETYTDASLEDRQAKRHPKIFKMCRLYKTADDVNFMV